MYRFYHLLFLIEFNAVLIFLHLYKYLAIKKKRGSDIRILALPYYSLNYAGGHSRIGDWKPYFEKNNIQYDVHWASEAQEFLQEFMTDNWLKKYWFYHKLLWRRVKVIFLLKNYDSIWIQRAFIPFYPFKDAYFEKLINQLHKNITIDFYDADYESNYNLTINAAKYSKKVTVASKYLQDFFFRKNIQTYHVRLAMDHKIYKENIFKKNDDYEIIIGWMGAPENFKNILLVMDELKEIERMHNNVRFHFICRELPKIPLTRYKQYKWGDKGFNYYTLISNFDIGIAPMIYATERDKGKTAFKTLEYMASGVPFVTSPWGVSDKLIDNNNCLFAYNKQEWKEKLNQLIEDEKLRQRLRTEAKKTLLKYHSYENVYLGLKQILI